MWDRSGNLAFAFNQVICEFLNTVSIWQGLHVKIEMRLTLLTARQDLVLKKDRTCLFGIGPVVSDGESV